jgi:outer membrane lipoprotein-sorting protein
MRLLKTLVSLLLFSVLFQSANAQEKPRTLTNTDVINMAKSGIGEQIIILTIQKATTRFDTSPDALIQLKNAGVSDPVLNAMLNASSAATGPDAAPEDCTQTLDKVLAFVEAPDKIAGIASSKFTATGVSNRTSGSSTYHVERITVWSGKVHVSFQPARGVGATTVITPEFNYETTGKMTMAVPALTLEDIETSLRLDLIYVAQNREKYSCTLGGNEQIGTVNATRLRIKGDAVAGLFDVDPSTGRLLRTAYTVGGSQQVTMEFSDWKPIQGINIAFKRHVTNGSGTIDLTVTDYQFNSTIDAALFQPPVGQPVPAVTLKVLQPESVPYTVQTNGGISTACNISGSTDTTMMASTYGNTTYGTATSTPNLQMNCRSSDTTIRWTHVLNAMFVEASDGNAYIIACDRAWAWSKCTPLRAGDTFLAKRGDKGFVVQSLNSKSKEQEATYSILQSKSLRE